MTQRSNSGLRHDELLIGHVQANGASARAHELGQHVTITARPTAEVKPVAPASAGGIGEPQP